MAAALVLPAFASLVFLLPSRAATEMRRLSIANREVLPCNFDRIHRSIPLPGWRWKRP